MTHTTSHIIQCNFIRFLIVKTSNTLYSVEFNGFSKFGHVNFYVTKYDFDKLYFKYYGTVVSWIIDETDYELAT